MFKLRKTWIFQHFAISRWLVAGFVVLAVGTTPNRNALQAADQQVDFLNSFLAWDSTYKTHFDPLVSPGKGTGWKPYNRMAWFYGQRATQGITNPIALRMEAWEDKLAARNPAQPLDENWSQIGPTNYAGRILCIAYHPTNFNTIFVGSASGGLWKTTDGGSNWTPLTDNLPSLAVSSIVFDPTNSNIMYFGSGEGSFNVDAVYGAGVFKSTDGGNTWNVTGLSWTQSQSRCVNDLVIDYNNPQVLYAACNSAVGGIYKTTNGGTSWTLYHTGDVKDLEIHPDSSSVIYAANGYPWGTTSNGVWKSTNSGVNWTQLSGGLPSGASIGRVDVAVSPSNPLVLYAGISQTISGGAGLYGIYKSTNGGATWTVMATTPNMFGGQGWYNLVCEVHPTNPDIVWSNGVDAYKSTNGGTSWTRMTIWTYPEGHSQYVHADHHAMAFKPDDPNTILLGTDGGMFKSTNGGTGWTAINNGLATYQYYAMCNDALRPTVAYGGTQDNGTNKYSNSSTHTRVFGGDGGYCNVSFTDSNIVYCTTQRGSHYKSTNGGTSFSSIQSGISGSGAWVTPRAMDPTNPSVLYTGTNIVYKTTNAGSSWTAISTALDASMISTIAVAPSDPNTIYIGYEGYDGKIFKTNNGGTNWTNIETGIPERYPTRIAVDPTNRDIVYVTVSGYSSGHVWKSTNGGSSWSNSSTGLPDLPVNVVVIDQSSPSTLYAGNDLGVYRSTDSGASWSDFSTGLPNVVVDDLALHPTTGKLRAGTHGRGMWETDTQTPSLAVLTPNGGESWVTGTAYTLTWVTGGIGGNVSIQLNRTYPGGSWETISSSTANDGSYSWTCSGSASSAARVKITSLSQPSTFDESNNNFSITVPAITVVNPNGGENWTVGNVQTIRWTKSGVTGDCQVRVKRDYPTGIWEFIALTSDTFYNWTVTAPTSSACRIQVYSNANPSIGDTSNANFQISGPWLTVDYPNGSELFVPGESRTIQWTKHDFSGNCKVEINRSYPTGTWYTLAASVAPDSLVWIVDQNGSAAARIRVTSLDYSGATDESNANFGIQYPTLAITAPNGGQSWAAGTTQSITWTNSNIFGPFNLHVNRSYPSGTWEPIALNVSTSPQSWLVTGPASTTARIRVSPVNIDNYYDDSNANFSITEGTSGLTVAAPNGGESWQVGTSQTISWTRSNADGAVTVSVNRTYPTGTWETITSSNTGNSQGWTVTGPVSSTTRVRVQLNSNPALYDESNANFSIVQPTLTLTAPNGGESYNAGASTNVTFTRTNATGNVTVQLMRNYPSGTWETLSTTVSTSSYAWTVSAPGSNAARIRIYLNSDPTIGDTSAANFTIVQPSITLSAPNGGESWQAGTTQTVRWSRQAASGGVRVMLNRDYPTGTWEQLASSITVDTLAWLVNTPVSNSAARVRVYLVSDPTLGDTSAAGFTITDPGLTITSPNGGESWVLNTANTIRWTRNNAAGNVTVQFKRNYPSGTWENITTTAAADTFVWTPTGTADANTRVRIYLTTQTSIGDTSNANFALVAPSITVTSPNGGENWPIGSTQTIRFTRVAASGAATVQLNRNNGSGAWETLNSNVSVDTLSWVVTGATTSNALVKVTLNSNGAITDNSNAVFTIIQPALTVTAPNGGEQITLGSTSIVRFTRSYASGAATIKLNRTYPSGAWETLTSACTADTFAWVTSGAASTTSRVAVELNAGGATSDTSNANFSLILRDVQLASHHSGTYYVGLPSTVNFTRTNLTGPVTISLNRNYPSANWETLASGITTSSYSWTPSGTPSSTARLRVVSQDYTWVGDTSAANLAIENASLTLLAPQSADTWSIGSQHNIAWTKSGTTSPVRVEFMRSYPSGSWETLSASETDTLFTWTVTAPSSAASCFRVVATANESLADTSALVQIAQPALTITAPTDNSTWNLGFPMTIAWSRYYASGTVNVQVNRSYPSAAWESLGSTSADSLVWTTTGAAGSVRFRVQLASNTSIADTTGNVTLYLPSAALTSPNGGESLRQGTSTLITWTRDNLSGPVRIDCNSNYPSGSWSTIASGQTGTSFNWNVTQSPTSAARVRVVYEQQTAYGDTSNANFTIFRPELTLTAPVGGEVWVTGTAYTISFTRTDHTQPVTIKLNRSYPNGAWEILASNVTGNSAQWTASGTQTTSARIRVESSIYSDVGDTCAANFSILNPGVALISPDGGETFAISRSETIRFQRVQVSAVNVYLNRNYPSGSWEQIASNLASDSLVWSASGPASTLCRVKVVNASNASQYDQSSANFSILQPAISFVTPIPGDTLAIGLANQIQILRNAAATGSVRLDINYTYPSGAWLTLGTSSGNEFTWTPPAPPSTGARLRIVHLTYSGVGDTLDFNIPIDYASLSLTAPTISQSHQIGDTISLAWTRIHVGNGAHVYLNRNYPQSNWELIASNVQADSYNWIVTGPRSSSAVLRVISARNSALGDSTPAQTVLDPQVTLTSHNSGVIGAGNVETITFSRTDFTSSIALDVNYSYPNGSWTEIASGLTGTSHNWTVGSTLTTALRLRARSEEFNCLDISDNSLSIVTPQISVLTQNDAELHLMNDPLFIQWSKTAVNGGVNVELNRDYPGGAWETLASNTQGGSLNWTINEPGFAHGRVRVTAANRADVYDVNDADFGTFLPALSISDPNGGDTLIIGQSKVIRWTRNGASGSARVQLNRNYPNGSWETLLAATSADSMVWTVSGAQTTTARVRVQLVFDSNMYDVSDENFAILPTSLALLNPGDADSVAIGDTVRFEWRRVGIATGVAVYLKRNYPSGQWEILASNVAVDTFAWVASGATSNNARFRVISTVNTALGDSAGPCPIGNPALTITSPSSAQTYVAGATIPIAWSRSFAPGTVKIELSRDGVNGLWTEIGQSDGTSFNWPVTAPATSSARFRISLLHKSWVQGATAFNNSIVIPDLDLTSPEPGDTIAVGREIVISWTRTYVPDPVDVMVDRGSPVADAEFIRQDVTSDSIHWIATPPITPNTRFVLRTSSGVLVEEDGDTVFVMANPQLTLAAPSGGEQWITGQNVTIQWLRAAVNDPVHVELNRNYPSGSWERLASSVSGTQYSWLVSGTASANARVRVISAVDGNLADICDAPLSIIIPALAFTGTQSERVPLGFPTTVAWQSNNLSGTVSLYLSRDNGATYPDVIASSLSSTSFAWTPSGVSASQARLKIQSDLQPNVNAVSSVFVLAQPNLQVSYPQNGETLSLGYPYTLRWNRNDHPGAVSVALNTDYPSGSWSTLASNVNADSLVWTASGSATTNARLRVTSSVNGLWSDLGDNNFTLIVPTLDLTAPSDASELVLGDQTVIRWQRIGWSGAVSVTLNRVGGASTQISASTTADSVAWSCSGTAAQSSWLVVRSIDTPTRADSVQVEGPFAPSIAITSHSDGARIVNGNAHTLRWSRSHLAPNSEILLNSGSGFVSVGTSADDSLVFTSNSPETNSAQLIVRSIARPDIADTSYSLRIVSPSVTLNAPSSLDMRVDYPVTFSWDAHEIIGDAVFELSRNGHAGPWEELYRGIQASFEWIVSGAESENVRVRVRSIEESQFADTLDAVLSIFRPNLALNVLPLHPVMYVGEEVSLEITGEHLSSVSLAIERDGNVETLTQLDVPAVFNWMIQGEIADSALFRVWVEGDEELIAESEAFELRVPSVSLEELPADIFADEVVTLGWSADGVSGPYEIIMLDESGETVIAEGIAENAFDWSVSGERGEIRLVVREQDAPQFGDTSDVIALHVPELAWISPSEAGVDTAGQSIELAWSAIDESAPVRVEVSLDAENAVWTTIAESVSETTFVYLLPAIETTSLRYRITSVAHESVSATSVARELIAPSLSLSTEGEIWYIGEQRWIHWSRHRASGDVSVDVNYGDRAEENWLPLSTTVSDSFLWTVEGPESELAAIRVRLEGNPAVFDTTNSPITIRAPRISVTEPNGGEEYDPTTLIRIRWDAEGLPAGVSIGLWRGAPVNRLDTLFLSTENDGDEQWVVTGPASDSCYIIVTADGDTSIHDLSDAPFRITNGTAIDPRETGLPLEVELGAPYPNPFNARVTIPFALPKDADVKIIVFDLLGREVETLEEGRRRAGYLHAQWNAANFASGTYFVQMRSDEFTDVRRLILMK